MNFPIVLKTPTDFAAEYPQPLDPTEMVSAGGGLELAPLKPHGVEGGPDDRWFHDDPDGELDAAWHRAALALMAKRKLEKAVTAAQASAAQLEAGNYKKKHIHFQGMEVSIENRKGSVREGKNKDGTPWRSEMHYDYGYIRRTEGTDGDHVDVYIGPDESSDTVYVVHQAEPETGRYDEDKCMLGFGGEEAAKAAYLKQYDSPKFFGAMTAVPFSMFKEKVFGAKGEPVVPDAARRVAEAKLKSLIARADADGQTNTRGTEPARGAAMGIGAAAGVVAAGDTEGDADEIDKSFKGHRGRKGKRGGSLPRSGAGWVPGEGEGLDENSKAVFKQATSKLKGIAAGRIEAAYQMEGDPDLTEIFKKGQVFDPEERTRVMGPGRDGECHWNAAKLFRAGKIDSIVIGYAFNNNMNGRYWFQHTWGLKDGQIVETTPSNWDVRKYFGLNLSKQESKAFADWAKANPPGGGKVRLISDAD